MRLIKTLSKRKDKPKARAMLLGAEMSELPDFVQKEIERVTKLVEEHAPEDVAHRSAEATQNLRGKMEDIFAVMSNDPEACHLKFEFDGDKLEGSFEGRPTDLAQVLVTLMARKPDLHWVMKSAVEVVDHMLSCDCDSCTEFQRNFKAARKTDV